MRPLIGSNTRQSKLHELSAANMIRSLFAELRRRRVFRAGGVYIVAAFAVLQGASVLVPALHLADWTMTLLVVLALAGLPVAVVLAWVFELYQSRLDVASVSRQPLAPTRGCYARAGCRQAQRHA